MPHPVHFEIHASDPERAITFYATVFEWSFERWIPDPYWLITTGNGSGMEGGLTQRRGPEPDPDSPVNAFAVIMQVDDIDLLTREVVQAGGSVDEPKSVIPGVGWVVYCKDTEGNLFGMMEHDLDAR